MERSKQPPRAEAGVVIGGYELVRRLGRGGMADVWVARRIVGASKFVAIKLLADHYVGDERYTRMFRAEAELATILSHANIVQVFDEGEEDGRSYLVMEWVDGINLLKLGAVLALLDDEERRFRVTSYIIGQLLYALGYAHSITSYDGSPLGVVHRDVSPQNVLISNHGEVKLTDFGVAYHVMEESSGIHVKGKIRYMSPEQISGKTRLPTVDLFAVGAILHELLDGKKFRHEYDDGQELITAVLSGAIPQMTRSIPPELDELRLRLLTPDPADRIQSAAEAVAWLHRYPGYGDARGELTTLCSTFTGIVKPRAGPGQSSQAPMAERQTTQFKGSKGLAKPRVSAEPPERASAPLRIAPATPGPASPNAAREGNRPASAAIITGDTEFIRPQQPNVLGKKQLFGGPSGATTAPLPSRARNLAVAQAPVAASPPPASVPEPTASAAPAPAETAYPAASFVPQEIVDSRSHPIAVPTHALGQPVPTVAPTERLGPSETSGARSGTMATELIDASMIVEVTSGSGTDRDIVPVAVGREGTDPSHEIRPQTVPPSHSINIVVQRRSAIAMLVVGLMMVAAISVTLTWWLFTRNAAEDLRAASDVAVESPRVASMAAPTRGETVPAAAEAKQPQLPPQTPPKPVAQPVEPPAAPSPGAASDVASGGDENAGGANDPGDASSNTPAGDARPEAEAEAEAEFADEPPSANESPAQVDPVSAADAGPPVDPDIPKKPLKVAVKVSALPSIATGQLKLGGTQFDIPKGKPITKKVSPGSKKVLWRTDPKSPWNTAKEIELEEGKPISIQLTFTGPRNAPK